MNQEQLRACQPQQFEYFLRILEQKQLNHAYLFSGYFGSLEMALFLSKSRVSYHVSLVEIVS